MAGEQLSIVWPGKPYPLGATWDGEGVNFALFSEHAEKVELVPLRSRALCAKPTASSFPSRRTWFSTATCRRRVLVCFMDTGCTAHTIPQRGIAL